MATHSSILAWRIPQTEKPGRLQSMGSHININSQNTSLLHFIEKKNMVHQFGVGVYINFRSEIFLTLTTNGKRKS